MKKDLLSEYDLGRADFESIFERAHRLKRILREGKDHTPLKGKTLGMIFDKSSTRTRIYFEVGMFQLGGSRSFSAAGIRSLAVGRSSPIPRGSCPAISTGSWFGPFLRNR